MGKDANALRKQILDAASVHPRVGLLVISNAGMIQMKHGGWFHAMPVGWPDLTGWLMGGRMLLVEIKTPTDRTRDAQRERLEDARRDGCCVIVARSVEDFVRGVEEA